ncbi:MAG: ABC transporter substrate-binding protein [marine bacterium B5-7]|nr:MAG: ABC transporter substrate-binding protein [marine bacterium B5-7]
MKKSFAITVLAIVAGLSGGTANAEEKVLNVLSYGGPWNEVQEQHVLARFKEETGYDVNLGQQAVNAVPLITASKENPVWDLVWMSAEDHAVLSREGLLEPLNYGNLHNAANLYDNARLEDGVITSYAAVAMVYNTEKFESPPTSWQDMWDPRLKGHVIVGDLPHSYGMSFLVMTARLAGGGEDNIDPGFARMKELKPSIAAFYKNSGVANQLFQQGEAWIAPWYHGRAKYGADRGIPLDYVIPEEGAPPYLSVLGVVKGTDKQALAERFIDMCLDAAPQTGWAEIIGAGPANKTVVLGPEIASRVPYGPDQISKLVMLDWKKIVEMQDEWTERWRKEIAQ